MRISFTTSTAAARYLSSFPFRFTLWTISPSINTKPLFSHSSSSHLSLPAAVSDTTMAAEGDSAYVSATDVSVDVSDDSVKYGFQRPEMYQSNLSGTVDPYDRHVFLCYKSHDSWPSKVEDSDSDLLPKLLNSAVKSRKNDIKLKTRLTVCEGGDDIGLSDGDVLIFPQMVKYRGLKETDVDGFVEDVLVNDQPWASGVQEVLTGSHVFVCAHNNRDRRCGVCGPVLIEKFKEAVESKGLKDQVSVTACSHVGGHKYAGNVIIFCADPQGKIVGHWYGYVTPDDVVELLDQQIGKGEVIERIWRGQMGAPVEDAEKVDKKIPNGQVLNNDEKMPQEISSEKTEESVASCCQGANGFSCCRDEISKEKQGKKCPGRLSDWVGKWEQREVLTTVAVVGAVATIAVAYSYYRRSR